MTDYELQHGLSLGQIIKIKTQDEGTGSRAHYTIRRYHIVEFYPYGVLTEYQHPRTNYHRFLTYWEADKALGRIPEVPTPKTSSFRLGQGNGRPRKPISKEFREAYDLWRSGEISAEEAGETRRSERRFFLPESGKNGRKRKNKITEIITGGKHV